jgi:hypothetical protein
MRRQLIWALLLVVASFGFASAQETTSGTITGKVVDAQGAPVPGATVTVTSPQGPKTIVTDAAGRFFAPYLTPGRYAVKVELSGFSPVEQKNIDVRLGQRLDLGELALKVGGLEEVVEVVGSAPVVDTSSTTVGGILDADALKRLPVGRNFTDTLYLVPGVSDSSYAGKANPSIGGASGLENNYIIDGVNVTNTGFGAMGSFSRTYGSLGTGVTSDFIKETQVKTGGFEAEYGQATGGVVNVVTESGTNEFHGALFGYWRPEWAESDWEQLTTVNGTINTTATDTADFGARFGGPLMKDKLFFFATFNPSFEKRTLVAPPGFPLASLGEVDRKRRNYSYAGKLSWQAGSNHRFDATFYGDPSRALVGPQRTTALLALSASRFSSINYGGHNQGLKYDGILSRSWLLEATLGHSSNKLVESPAEDTHQTTDTTVTPFIRSGGIGFYEADNGNNYQVSLKSTNIFNAAGNHQLRYGVMYEDIDYFQGTRRTGPSFTLANGQQTVSGATISVLPDPVFGKIWRVTRGDLSAGRATTQKYTSFFLQDTWQMGRLTLRPGVRYDRQQLEGSSEPPWCWEGTARMGEVGSGPANLACNYTFDNNWGPRVGATYDIAGNGRSKVFASWGRFYVKVPNDMAARAMAADASATRADYFDAALTRPVPNGTLAAGTTSHLSVSGNHAAVFDTDVKSTYSDEFLGGVEFEPIRGVNVGLRYINRSIPRVMEDIGLAQALLYADVGGVEYFITNVTAQSPTLDPATFGHSYPQAHFEDPTHKYQAVELTANKSFSNNWSLMASYRWAKLSGDFEGFFRSDNGQADPSITSLFDFPTNDPSYTQVGSVCCSYRGDIRFLGTSLGQGRLPNDRPHQFKLYTNYAVGALDGGLALNVGSGRSLTALAANPVYENSGEIPETLRGEGIQTVDGFKKTTATEVILDLHLGYTVKLGAGNQRLVLLGDVFNLVNNRDPLDYDNYTESGFTTPNPDFGTPKAGGGAFPQFHTPRQIRIGARFEW